MMIKYTCARAVYVLSFALSNKFTAGKNHQNNGEQYTYTLNDKKATTTTMT